MEERLRLAEVQLKGAQHDARVLRAGAQDAAAMRREIATLEQDLAQVSDYIKRGCGATIK